MIAVVCATRAWPRCPWWQHTCSRLGPLRRAHVLHFLTEMHPCSQEPPCTGDCFTTNCLRLRLRQPARWGRVTAITRVRSAGGKCGPHPVALMRAPLSHSSCSPIFRARMCAHSAACLASSLAPGLLPRGLAATESGTRAARPCMFRAVCCALCPCREPVLTCNLECNKVILHPKVHMTSRPHFTPSLFLGCRYAGGQPNSQLF
jgi:hypothetical protein